MEASKNRERDFKNLRVRAEIFNAIAGHCYRTDKSLARAIEDALQRYIEDEGIGGAQA